RRPHLSRFLTDCCFFHYRVQKADVIDVWNGPFEENAELAVVDRIEVVDYALTTIGYDIHVKTWKKFLVSNWKQSTQ
uniref:RNA-binding S4 domain-containing protein n=1 Tax=Parascaris univalens TaxID=6257 RepID=A0A915B191_PARUN